MNYRIEVSQKVTDGRAKSLKNKLGFFGFDITKIKIIDVYTINKKFLEIQVENIAQMLANPIVEEYEINSPTKIKDFDWALEIGFLPGVTDNIASTVKEQIEESLGEKFKDNEGVYSSQLIFLKSENLEKKIEQLSLVLHNPIIQRVGIKSVQDYKEQNGMNIVIPQVNLSESQQAEEVDLNVSDEELIIIGKQGIKNIDGSRRGPLALDLESMKTIQTYFKKEGRRPTDIEIESISQTWSEHCKHTIFAETLDEIKNGLYKDYIQKATNEIRRKKKEKDICVSVFTDNSGAIIFDDEYLVSDKVETHNSPSALDPFGGAITGIVGVNRDAIGFGMGAKPVLNRYGFCLCDPRDEEPLYKDSELKQEMLSPRKIMQGVIEGVRVGGNCSGIPTPQGFLYFDRHYKGKPLVFVGTVGLIPRKINGADSFEKKAKNEDFVVVIGGRVGADGVHGATFSSEALDSGSPATAVQIGDPITQKKLSDVIVKEARGMGLYNSITDNGAGGISCSVAEMAKESGGFTVDLDKVPLKYHGLSPWEIWISESQERMTLSVPKEKWEVLRKLMEKRGVEATVIGEFNDSGKCKVNFNGKKIMELDMEFLHNGLPHKALKSTYTKNKNEEPKEFPNNLNTVLKEILKRPNISSFEFISTQYDHEVQGGSVLKPLQGTGRVNAYASVLRPRLNSNKGVVVSQGINPSYSDIDTYHMAACSIDTAIRNAIAVGGNLEKLTLLDNFCWCSSNEPERLGQLKEAVKACYDYAIQFETPFISGKDSMFNDFNGYTKEGAQVKISVPPTLLISSFGIVDNINNTIDFVPKFENDLIYVIGETKEELGGSEYFAYLGEIGNSVPKVDGLKAKKIYQTVQSAIENKLISSCMSVTSGGLGVAIAKKAIAGRKGMEIDLSILQKNIRNDFLLFSESQSRFVVTIDPNKKKGFEKALSEIDFYLIGLVRKDEKVVIKSEEGEEIIDINVNDLEKVYKATFKEY